MFGKVLLEGRGIFGGGACSCFGGLWHFLLWRGVAFLEGAFSVIEGCGIFGECFGGVTFWKRHLQSFGGVWHFWRALAVFWRGVAFFEGCFGGT